MGEHANTFLLITILAFVTVLLVFAMKYFSAARQARLRIASEDAYRQLAQKAVNAQAESASALAEITTRLAAVERILKEVG